MKGLSELLSSHKGREKNIHKVTTEDCSSGRVRIAFPKQVFQQGQHLPSEKAAFVTRFWAMCIGLSLVPPEKGSWAFFKLMHSALHAQEKERSRRLWTRSLISPWKYFTDSIELFNCSFMLYLRSRYSIMPWGILASIIQYDWLW